MNNRIKQLAEPKNYWATPAILLLAVALPWWGLSWAGVSPLSPWPAAPAPFGFARLLLAQLILSLPLSCWVAGWLPIYSSSAAAANSSMLVRPSIVALLIGAVLSLSAGFLVQPLAREVGSSGQAFAVVIRVGLVLLLQLPLCIAARFEWSSELPTEFSLSNKTWLANGLIAVLAATLLPQSYSASLCRAETLSVHDSLRNGFVMEAAKTVNAIQKTGSQQLILDEQPRALFGQLFGQIQQFSQLAAEKLPESATDDQIIDRAKHWLALAEMAQAESLLKTLPSNPRALILLVAIYDQQGDAARAVEGCRTIISTVQKPEFEAVRDSFLGTSIERLTHNLRKLGRYREAEQFLVDGMASGGPNLGRVHYELGKHYRMGGRPGEAISQFETARELDPRLSEPVAAALVGLSNEISGCIFRPARQVSR